MDKNKIVKVTNRNNGTVGYIIPEMGNLQRQFAPKVTKEVTFEELQNLYNLKGGRVLLENYLIIEDPEVVKALQFKPEPEYYYTDEQVKDIMVNGTMDQFLDMLDYSNKGVKDSIKNLAVDIPLNDVAKRKAILDKLNFNVDNAIIVKNTKFDGDNQEKEEKKVTKRRAAVPFNTETKKENTGRRYKVISE